MSYMIYKYPLDITDEQVINIHQEGGGLCAKYVGGEVVLYALVNTESETVPITVRIFGTGRPIPDEELPVLQYIDTVIEPIGDEEGVWHIYVKVSPQ